jgi:PAS domain S-box-containing protein
MGNEFPFEDILDNLFDQTVVLDSDCRILKANRTYIEAYGRSVPEPVMLHCREIMKQSDRLDPEAGESTTYVLKAVDGNSVNVELKAIPFKDEKGRVKFVVVILRDLSVEMLIETKLRGANEFLTNLIESSVDGIIAADMKGTVIMFNKGAETLLGFKAEEVIGKFNASNFYPPGVAREILSKLRSENYGGKGKLTPSPFAGVTKHGEQIPVSLSGALIYQDGREVATVGFFYDLREILKAQEDLLESETKFRNLFERVQHGIYFSTREGKFQDGNRALLEMLGYDNKEEFLAMDLARDLYFDARHRPVFQQMIERDGFVKNYEVRFKKKNGEAIDVLLTAHVQKDRSRKVLGYQGIVYDITERRKLERELLQSEKLAAMGRLTAQIAHELNNPIYGVMNCLDLLKSEVPEDNKKRKFLEMGIAETKRMSELLRSMFQFFRPSEDVKISLNLNRLIEEVVLFVGKQLDEFKVLVNLELEGKLPDIVASGNQIKQVLLNMIMNARNAMAEGGTLTISTERDEESVMFKIEDTGIGIAPENRDRIFEAFFTTKIDVKGVGLGLSVCFGIVRDHGGTIEVESEVGVGTIFTVILPLEAKD